MCSFVDVLPKKPSSLLAIFSAQLEFNGVCRETGQLPELMFSSSGPLAETEVVWTNMTSFLLEKSCKSVSLDRDERGTLHSVYSTLYPRVTEISFKVAKLYKKFKSLTIGGEKYGSTSKLLGLHITPTNVRT